VTEQHRRVSTDWMHTVSLSDQAPPVTASASQVSRQNTSQKKLALLVDVPMLMKLIRRAILTKRQHYRVDASDGTNTEERHCEN